ncbi:AI-2E family transporter [Azotobacter salinestris]|uniref:AI-2E family transporter n=1 Tax=Azotobacter salinestris TaxID=69964 RepID=UPI0032DE802A
MSPKSVSDQQFSRNLLDVLIRAGLVAVLTIYCYRVFRPFLELMLWSLILAVMLYPLQRRLAARLGHHEGRAASLIVVVGLLILMVPIYLLGTSLVDSAQGVVEVVKSGTFSVPQPPDSVAGWPLIGQPVHDLWQQAASDLSGSIQRFRPQIRELLLGLLARIAGIGTGLLLFIAALIIAGIIMAFGDLGHRSAHRIAARIVGPDRGEPLVELCTATIRTVAQGVLGIAFIQMLLVGVGFVLMGIPGAGLLALAVLLLGIIQVPATLITVPVIVYVFSSEGASLTTIAFAVYSILAGLVDNLLKPLLLGRGVDVPMPVVLIGALGGMVASGILGLFIGPIILAVGYRLFWQWVDSQPAEVGVGGPGAP